MRRNPVEPRLVTTVDRALAPALSQAVSAAVDRIGARASYWKTFWYPLDAPANVIERAIDALSAHVDDPRVIGCEWWIGRMDTRRVPLDFHHDRDLASFERTGRLSFPRWSSVLYLSSPVGGHLAVTDQRLVRRGADLVLSPRRPTRFETVHPEPNRFVRFPGKLLHGVLDANGEVPSKPVRDATGDTLRTSLVVNWWHRRPEGIERWSRSRAYPTLRGT